jgi:hypothetical protein
MVVCETHPEGGQATRISHLTHMVSELKKLNSFRFIKNSQS